MQKATSVSSEQAKRMTRELSAAGKAAERMSAKSQKLASAEMQLNRTSEEQKVHLAELMDSYDAEKQKVSELEKVYETIKQTTKGLDLSTPLTTQSEEAKAAVEKIRAEYDALAKEIQRVQAYNQTGAKGVEALDAALADMQSHMAQLRAEQSKAINYEEFSSVINRIDALQKKMNQTQAARERLLQGMGVNIQLPDNSIATMDQAQAKLRDLGNELEQARSRSAQLENAIAAIGQENLGYATEKGLKQLQSEIGKSNGKMSQLEMQAARTRDRMDTYGEKLEDVHREQNQLSQSADDLKAHIENLEDGSASAAGGIVGKIGNALKGIPGVISKITHPIQTLTSKFPQLSKAAQSAGSGVGNSFKTFLKYTLGIRSLYILVNKLRSALSTGFSNLAKESSQVNSALSSMKSSLTMLQNSLAAAFSPLVTAVAPMIASFIQTIADAISYVGAFFAVLTGKSSYTKAVYNYQSISDGASSAASSTNDANEAAEEYQKTLAGFDEITKLNDQNSSSGSGGSGGGGGSGSGSGVSFETVDIPNVVSDWAEKFKEAWEKADFTEFGNIVGTKLKNALDSIDWDGIQKQCEKIAKSIATFLNGFIETEGLAESIGNTVGEAIYTGLDLVDTFAKTFHWESLGQFIADGINGAINTLSSKDINFGSTLADLLNGAISSISGFVDTVKWSKIGEFISDNVNRFFSDTNWAKVGQTANDLIHGLADMVTAAVRNIDAEKIGQDVADFLSELDIPDVVFTLTRVAVEITGSVTNTLTSSVAGLMANVMTDASASGEVKQAAEDAAYNILSTTTDNTDASGMADLGAKIGEAIKNGILQPFSGVGNWASELFNSIVSGIKNIFGIHSPASAPELVEAANNIGEGIKEGILEPFTDIGNWVNKNILTPIKNALGSNEKFSLSASVKLAKDGWSSVASWVKDHIGGAVSKAIGLGKNGWSSVASWVNERIGGSVSKAVGLAKNGWSSVAAWVKTKLGGTVNKPIGLIRNGWTTVASWVKKYIGGAVSKVVSLVSGGTKATGGMYRNGHWSPITAYASGGEPNQGQLFLAREAGPELVGSIGSGTAVMNNNQIVSSVSDGVYRAVRSAMAGGSGNQNVTVQVMIDSKVAGEAFVSYLKGQAAQGSYPLTGLT